MEFIQEIDLKEYLDRKVHFYNRPEFIENDPISVPHRFTGLQDIEISAFFAAIFAWGQRKTIINKANNLIERMDNAPFDFVQHHSPKDLKKLQGFMHRTFNDDDALYFIQFFKEHYKRHESLEKAFTLFLSPKDENVSYALRDFRNYFFSWQHMKRTEKHIATPAKNSACKRINMFLRWMVRKDNNGVDFGLWNNIKTSQLFCPLDVHVLRVANRLGLIKADKADFKTLLQLQNKLLALDSEDPVKYDFALFGIGVEEKF